MLDKKGAALAILIGAVLFYISIEYLIVLITFLAFAVIATKYGYFEKKEMGIYEHERGWENVLSNGFGPILFAIGSYWFGPVPYLCSVSAVMSDKFASELGVLSGDPVSLKDFKRVKAGTSGAVSIFGTLMSLGGAIIIGTVSIFLFNITPTDALVIGLIGFVGALVDSLFGVFEEMGIGTKGTTNFICSASAGLLGLYLMTNYLGGIL